MKTHIKTLLAIAGISTFVFTSAFAQPYPNAVWTIDENGNGSFYAPPPPGGGSPVIGYSNGHLQMDPISGITGLYYNFGPASQAGDVVLLEPGAPSGPPSDLLRFDGQGGVYFFSDLDGPPFDLADVPVMPQPINPVFINEVGPEGNNGAFYTPLAGQPGFDTTGLLPNVSYNIISDVPEPASATLLLAGAGLWLLNIARRKNS